MLRARLTPELSDTTCSPVVSARPGHRRLVHHWALLEGQWAGPTGSLASAVSAKVAISPSYSWPFTAKNAL
eukprot:11628970-Alexandrium_andersonii.AAC.1